MGEGLLESECTPQWWFLSHGAGLGSLLWHVGSQHHLGLAWPPLQQVARPRGGAGLSLLGGGPRRGVNLRRAHSPNTHAHPRLLSAQGQEQGCG